MKLLFLLTIGTLLGCASLPPNKNEIAQIPPPITKKKVSQTWPYIPSRGFFLWTSEKDAEAINTFFGRPRFFAQTHFLEQVVWKGRLLAIALVGLTKPKILKMIKSTQRLMVYVEASHLLDDEILSAIANLEEVSIRVRIPRGRVSVTDALAYPSTNLIHQITDSKTHNLDVSRKIMFLQIS